MRPSMRTLAAGIGVTACLLIAGVVAAMTVQPVAVDMKMAGRDMSAPVRVENNGPTPLPVEVRIVETDFADDTVTASDRPSEDVMVFPPQAIIAPGETQVFRLQYVGDPAADRSRHYYAEVSQLPVELPEGQSAIQVLYNFQVMVNVASMTGGAPDLSITGAEIVKNGEGKNQPVFTVRNAAKNYGYLSTSQLTIVHKDAAGKELTRRVMTSTDIQQMIGFGLVGPEKTRKFTAPVDLSSAEGSVEVRISTPRRR